MDRTIRVHASFAEMKADEYRYWQSRPVHERMAAVSELTLTAYSLKGPVSLLPRSEWPFVCLERGAAPIAEMGRERTKISQGLRPR